MSWLFRILAIALLGFSVINSQDRVAPGVPPQHYQQNVHQQMPQHQTPQYQQVPQQQQYQQAPQMQQHQVPVHQQQPTYNTGHNHGHHGEPQQILNAANIAQEKEHIAEHMDVPIDTSKMSEQELQFHYFKMHDSDNNNKLDGLELIKSLIHWHEEGKKNPGGQVQEKIFTDEELVALIDPILDMDDANRDGYIDYPEFIQAQQRAPKPPANKQQ